MNNESAEAERCFRACLKSGILALQTPKFYLAGSKRARKSGFLQSIDRKNPQVEQALMILYDIETLTDISKEHEKVHNGAVSYIYYRQYLGATYGFR
jgi:hypothetical protein